MENLQNSNVAVDEKSFDEKFLDIFMPTNGTVEPESVEGNPISQDAAIVEQGLLPKEDPSRYEYWQSQATKKENELRELQNNLLQIQMQLANQGKPAEPEVPTLSLPTKPEKPRNFNVEDANSDPNSESWKYRENMIDYQEKLVEYHEKKTSLAEQANLAFQQQFLKERQMEQAKFQEQQKLAETQNVLMSQYGMSANEVEEFVNVMSNPQVVNIDNLVKLFKLSKGQQVTTQNQNLKVQDMIQQRRIQAPPPPISGSAGGSRNIQDFTPDQLFNATLFNYSKKR